MSGINKKDILNKDYDYTRLTKPQLREVMSMLNCEDIPSLYVKKDELLEAYKEQVYDKLDQIDADTFTFKKSKKFSTDNTFQQSMEQFKTKDKKTAVKKEESKKVEKAQTKSSTAPKSHETTKNTTKDKSREITQHKTQSSGLKSLGKKLHESQRARTKGRVFAVIKFLVSALVLTLVVYLKFFIPYCEDDRVRYCILVPRHGHLINKKLFCDKGFRKTNSLIVSYCVFDTRIEYNNRMNATKIIRNLEYLKGEYDYGYVNSAKIRTKEIEANDAVLSMLKESDLLIFQGSYIEALNKRVSFNLIIRFYTMRFLKSVLSIIFILLMFKILFYGRAQRNKSIAEAKTSLPKILMALNKQAVIAAKTISISNLVYSVQLQDAFEMKDEVWVYIENLLKENSNVAWELDENQQLRFKWIGILFTRSTSNVQLTA